MKILAVDPGPTPGLATWDTDEQLFYAWVAPGWMYGCEYITQVDADSRPVFGTIVIESFAIGGSRRKSSNETIEMIGVARWFALEWDIPFVEQPPGAQKFGSPAKLKKLGWYESTKAKGDHARSATGHLLLYLVQQGLIDGTALLD